MDEARDQVEMQKHSLSIEEIPRDELSSCLLRIFESKEFAGSDRMKDFLSHVVQETLEGRKEQIRAKSIALDVYARSITSDGDSENVVRVDARRLRRKLDKYYATVGASDALRIHIDSGGYAPRFELLEVEEKAEQKDKKIQSGPQPIPQPQSTTPNRRAITFGLASALSLAGVALLAGFMFELFFDPSGKMSDIEEHKRAALLEKSHKALQASNYAAQARDQLLPLFDYDRQSLTLSMFRHVIRLDPETFQGYAGAAQALASLALLSPSTEKRSEFLSEARVMADQAIAEDPTEPWSLSSAAWVAFAEQNYDEATRLAESSFSLAPDDGHVVDYYGLIALFTGNFAVARNATMSLENSDQGEQRLGGKNIIAASSFHLGEYQNTLDALEEVAKAGGPISPPRLAYEVAALHALNRNKKAADVARKLQQEWPDSAVDAVLLAFFRDSQYAYEVIERLHLSGWQSKN